MRSGSVQVGGPLLPERVTLRAGQRLTAKLASGEMLIGDARVGGGDGRAAAGESAPVRTPPNVDEPGEPAPAAGTVAPSSPPAPEVAAVAPPPSPPPLPPSPLAAPAPAPEPPSASPPPAPAPAPAGRGDRGAEPRGPAAVDRAPPGAARRSGRLRAAHVVRRHHQRRRRPRRRGGGGARPRQDVARGRQHRAERARRCRPLFRPARDRGPRAGGLAPALSQDAVRARGRVFPGSARRRSRRGRGGAGLVPPLSRRDAGRAVRGRGAGTEDARGRADLGPRRRPQRRPRIRRALPERDVHAAGARNPGESSTVTAARRMRSNRCGWCSAMLVAAAVATLPAARPAHAAPEAGAAAAVPAMTKVTVVDPPGGRPRPGRGGTAHPLRAGRRRSEQPRRHLRGRRRLGGLRRHRFGRRDRAVAPGRAGHHPRDRDVARRLRAAPPDPRIRAGGRRRSVGDRRARRGAAARHLPGHPARVSQPGSGEAAAGATRGRRAPDRRMRPPISCSCASFSARRCCPASAGSGPRSRR